MSIKEKLYNYKLKINCKKEPEHCDPQYSGSFLQAKPPVLLICFLLLILCSKEYEEYISLSVIGELLQIRNGIILGIFRYFIYQQTGFLFVNTQIILFRQLFVTYSVTIVGDRCSVCVIVIIIAPLDLEIGVIHGNGRTIGVLNGYFCY